MRPDDRRLEELALNSSAPPGQLLYDGWLLRLLAGKAKRARSVNAVYPSTRALDEKIAYCERLYADAGVPMLFRITPFSDPPALDRELERRGYVRYDPTAVEACDLDPARLGEGGAEPMSLPEWVDAVGELRDSPEGHRQAHLARLRGMPLALQPVVVRAAGAVAATGLAIREGDCVGLFDIITRESERRRGHARRIVATLLRRAWEEGARYAYLQVQQGNDGARRLYRALGFAERYLYWYRARPEDAR